VVRRVVNGVLGAAGVRAVSADWGPRGFAAALQRVKRCGVAPGQIVDVGAASGAWTRECLGVFPDARYFLVDPLEENRGALETLAAPRPNVSVWHGALGAREGQVEMHVHGDQSSVLSSEFAGKGDRRVVPVRTLDSFLGKELRDPPALIKADVQGYELEVLKGAATCLRSAELLLLEVSFRRMYAGCPLAHEVIAFAGERGFRVYDVCSYLQRPRDGELVQADVLLAREGSKLFEFEGYA
jgi:FkbM family methyltransferase